MEIPFNTIINVGVFIAYVLVMGSVITYFQETTLTMGDSGSPSALTYKLLSTPDISYVNAKNFTRKFIFNVSALDRYNNMPLPVDVGGSYYFVEVRDMEYKRVWRFSNVDFKYAYNVRLRGLRPANEPAVKPCVTPTSWTLQEYTNRLGGDPFQSMGEGGLFTTVTLVEGDRIWPGVAFALVDPDSSYTAGAYAAKYPLCICDIDCPADNGCVCSSACLLPEVTKGNACGVK